MIIKTKEPDQFDNALGRIADKINARRRSQLLSTYTGADGFLKEMHQLRESDAFDRGNKDRSARHVARIPAPYWKYLEDLYEARTGSRKFHQDLKFLRAECPEFLTIHTKDL